jgi:minor histocompatibility antigen H13
MRARGIAAADAIIEAIGCLTGQESGDEVATLTGTAAEDAYDRIANLELEQQDRSQGLSSENNTVFTVSDAVLQNRTYFVSVVIAYIVGLSAAFAANEVTGLGQPALLYLVPCTIGAIVLTALSRREVSRVWRFTDTRRK